MPPDWISAARQRQALVEIGDRDRASLGERPGDRADAAGELRALQLVVAEPRRRGDLEPGGARQQHETALGARQLEHGGEQLAEQGVEPETGVEPALVLGRVRPAAGSRFEIAPRCGGVEDLELPEHPAQAQPAGGIELGAMRGEAVDRQTFLLRSTSPSGAPKIEPRVTARGLVVDHRSQAASRPTRGRSSNNSQRRGGAVAAWA
jgi:hypothetical protein